jgi:hypothetical protein
MPTTSTKNAKKPTIYDAGCRCGTLHPDESAFVLFHAGACALTLLSEIDAAIFLNTS